MNYLVVGGSSGIGLALVKKLFSEGHVVYSASRQRGELPDGVHFIELDVTSEVEKLKDSLPEVLDGIAYCPGTINLKPFARLKEEDFLNDFKVNVLGAVKVIQSSTAALKKSESASIILFSTVAVQTGMGFHASIAASKGAIEGLTKSLAAEFAPIKIRVNALAPSLTETPLAKSLISTPERKEASDKRHPLGRIGTAEELADAAFFLISPQSSWITGQILGIDGGMSSVRNF
ncbi:MAG: SDR family oxidoreductase [Bacteroidetes bacterium]|nr:SDR family oxidoreductase [Bacteroidota bacterium]MBU1371524.1 SDR family oxidoreductase [Bacteroidota bacterium]MBU1485143.1 SDR family oxidoreductase [Bacteroidota bacterium]MBU1760362.1 SDR family oxidoreductase [Bacteroidota bacterium]MBU2266626.1 SDR family oxidoreductase [Bacteroidota bacterium]